MELHNTKLFDTFKCSCKTNKTCCDLHFSYTNKKLWECYENFDSPARLPFNILVPSPEQKTNDLTINYCESVCGHYFDTGHSIEYEVDGKHSYVISADKKYTLKQFHFHTPSEHSVQDVFYPVECHFVHEHKNCEDGHIEILVIALLLELGDTNVSFVEKAFDKCKFGKKTKIDLSLLNNLSNGANSYNTFVGTLTTPPFSAPNTKWYLFTACDVTSPPELKLTITKCHFEKLLEFYQNNRGPRNENEQRYSEPKCDENYLGVRNYIGSI